MTKNEIIHLLETDYLLGNININEVKLILGFDLSMSSNAVFTELGIYDEFKKIQNKRRGLSAKKTNLARYGIANGHNKESLEKLKQRSLEKYGVENPFQAEEVKEKSRQTKLARYNDSTFTNRAKCKQTVKDRYGVDNVYQLESVKQKKSKTKLERYGSATYNNADKMNQTKNMKRTKFEMLHNCSRLKKFISQYGRRCYSVIEYLKLPVYYYNDSLFIDNNSIDKLIEGLNTILPHSGKSYKELEIIDSIKSYYSGSIIHSDRTAIKPKEIDIYLPDLNIGIEYNGNYWHCIENGTPVDHHLQKSILCREKGIRLIHIYEFEDIEIQKKLLKDLINGIDNYPKDWNKNNLIEGTPIPKVIYKDNKYTIYGVDTLVEVKS